MERRERQCIPVPKRVPWLIFPCGKNRKDQTFCTISAAGGTTVELKSIPELRRTVIWASYHGWLLLTTEDDDDDHLIFWHPTTYESIKLPPLPSGLNKDMIISSIFTTSPKNPGCTVMLFDHYNATITHCQPGDQEWTNYDYLPELGKGAPVYDLACLDGIIYAFTSHTNMVSIEFDNQTAGLKFANLGLEKPSLRMFTGSVYKFLVESYGELYAIYVLVDGINRKEIFGIEVFRWDLSQKTWVEVENLVGRLIFLGSKWNCTSCLATAETTGNRIYFMMPKDKQLYIYDLEDGKILTSLPCPRLQTPWYQPFWVMPHDHDVQMKLPEQKGNASDKHTKVELESPRNMDASANQYPHNLCLDGWTAVARHLQPLDYLEFRATCKLFCSAAPATQWSLTSIICSLKSPWLVTFRYNKNVFNFIDPKRNNTYHMNVPQSLRGTLISGSKEGCMLMVDGKTLFYFNPFTGMQVKLPTPLTCDNKVSFSSSPSSPDCLMVRIDEDISQVDFMRRGDDYWSRVALEGDNRAFKKNGLGVFFEGAFYWLGHRGNLGVLRGGDEDRGFSWEVLVKPQAPCSAFHHNYLVECNGGLMAVFVGRNGSWVKVFSLDTSKMSWVRVQSLGNSALYVSNVSSIAALATSPEMANKVYFPRFHDQHIVYYSLETEKFHAQGSDIALDNFVDTKEQLYCTWIESRD